ncbi:MAG: type II toxin-antitoxin system RelE/ParE family toxin [Acidobacteria bacterium]|nr:type II toxin-antitoxin system RelE/ParE family toxin [Acidobacteriota bacterium]
MAWEVEYSDEFGKWWNELTVSEQESVDFGVRLLEERGPSLARPYADTVEGSKFQNMKELRVQHEGRPYRVFFAFDPRRMAYLLIGGDKTGDNRFYDTMIPRADEIYARHLYEIGDV